MAGLEGVEPPTNGSHWIASRVQSLRVHHSTLPKQRDAAFLTEL